MRESYAEIKRRSNPVVAKVPRLPRGRRITNGNAGANSSAPPPDSSTPPTPLPSPTFPRSPPRSSGATGNADGGDGEFGRTSGDFQSPSRSRDFRIANPHSDAARRTLGGGAAEDAGRCADGVRSAIRKSPLLVRPTPRDLSPVLHAPFLLTPGSPRITRELRSLGLACSENRVARVMRSGGLRARPIKPFRPKTTEEAEGTREVGGRASPAPITPRTPRPTCPPRPKRPRPRHPPRQRHLPAPSGAAPRCPSNRGKPGVLGFLFRHLLLQLFQEVLRAAPVDADLCV